MSPFLVSKYKTKRNQHKPDSKESGIVSGYGMKDMASILGRKTSLRGKLIPARKRAKHLPSGHRSSGSGERVPIPLYLQQRLSIHGALPPRRYTRSWHGVWWSTKATLFLADMPSHTKYSAQNHACKNDSSDEYFKEISGWGCRFGFRTAMDKKTSVFWDIIRCSPLKINRRFGAKYRLQ
jgi:hypothetical protein